MPNPFLLGTYCCIENSYFQAGGMAQMIDCITSKHEAPSSNPNTTKKKKKIAVFLMFEIF
jgi:hypothetical protein